MAVALPVIREARACAVCAESLPMGPRPLLAGTRTSRLLIIGQAPGLAAHDTGVPWNDKSGQRLREWLGLTDEQFYNDSLVALMPMGFCYPGKGKSGDMAPRPECAPLWHARMLKALKSVELTVLIGRYAIEHYLASTLGDVTETVAAHRKLLPDRIAVPHPSPRNNIWLKKNAWFASKTLPVLRKRVGEIIER